LFNVTVGDNGLKMHDLKHGCRYSVSDNILNMGIERVRNLNALFVPDEYKMYEKSFVEYYAYV